MNEAAQREFVDSQCAIMCAAVADYAPAEVALSKIKREKQDVPTIVLKKNPDIAAGLGAIKADNQILVGFALETDNATANAVEKIERKNLDFIVLNTVTANSGFQVDTNQISIIDADGTKTEYSLKPKREVAKDIVDHLVENLKK